MSDRPAVRPVHGSGSHESGTHESGTHDSGASSGTASRFAVLPRRITLEETVESHPADRPADPESGRNPDNDRLLRHGA